MSQPHTVFKCVHDFRVDGNLNFESSLFLFPGREKKPHRYNNIWISLAPDSGPLDVNSAPAPTAVLSLGEGTRSSEGNAGSEFSSLHVACVYMVPIMKAEQSGFTDNRQYVNIIDKISWFSVTMSAAFMKPAWKQHFPPPQFEGLIEIIHNAMTSSQTL